MTKRSRAKDKALLLFAFIVYPRFPHPGQITIYIDILFAIFLVEFGC
ncbi:MAG: hypothetical protein AB1327_02380 [Bacillota bacterium]